MMIDFKMITVMQWGNYFKKIRIELWQLQRVIQKNFLYLYKSILIFCPFIKLGKRIGWKINLVTWIYCWIRLRATVFSAPLGTMTSAHFLVGKQNSSNAGLTRSVYWANTCWRSLPLSAKSRSTRLQMQ